VFELLEAAVVWESVTRQSKKRPKKEVVAEAPNTFMIPA